MAAKAKKKASKKRAPPAATPKSEDAKLSARPIWQGNLRLSLVSCPVALYNATSRTSDISFHLLNPETNNRIRMVPTDPETGPVNRADLVKGYEISKNHYVILEKHELDAVKLETTRSIEIERFVDENEIDRLFWNDPYYLLPSEKSGVEAYAVIRDAMNATGRVALGRVVMHTRERLMAVEPRGRGLIAYSLRTRDEVLDVDGAFKDLPATKPDKKMIEIAEQIIAQQEGPFQPELFEDRYENALRELIRLKEKGKKPVTVEPPKDTNVIDLMDALRKSLKGKPAKSLPARTKTPRAKKSK